METGLTHIYYGNGKGKTTAAVGLCVRAVGNGNRVLFVQFLKGQASGEIDAFEQLSGIESLRAQKLEKFTWEMTPEEISQVHQDNEALLAQIKNMLTCKDYRLLVLDEALTACSLGLLDEHSLISLVQEKPAQLEVVFTGQEPTNALIALADYVSNIEKIKHPFDKGTPARKGIEF